MRGFGFKASKWVFGYWDRMRRLLDVPNLIVYMGCQYQKPRRYICIYRYIYIYIQQTPGLGIASWRFAGKGMKGCNVCIWFVLKIVIPFWL